MFTTDRVVHDVFDVNRLKRSVADVECDLRE